MPLLLAHLSDAHIGPLPQPRRRELIGKRLTGYLNWTRARAHIHDMDVLGRLVADMRAQAPDHIAMTGDILNIGLAAEFPPAKAWLETLGSPHDVSFTPGNHDAYVRGSLADLARTFAPWTTGDQAAGARYPYRRVRKGVAFIGLSSGVPTAPFVASGRLGTRQREACEALLIDAGRQGLVRVVMLHHPPLANATGFGRALTDASAFEEMIARAGAELIVHGHNHKLSVRYLQSGRRPVPVVGVASASAYRGTPDHRAGYNLFTIDLQDGHCSIKGRSRGLLPGTLQIGDLGEIGL